MGAVRQLARRVVAPASGVLATGTAVVSVDHGWPALVVTAVVALTAVVVTAVGKDIVRGFFCWLDSPLRTLRWALRTDRTQTKLTAERFVSLLTVALAHQAAGPDGAPTGRPAAQEGAGRARTPRGRTSAPGSPGQGGGGG